MSNQRFKEYLETKETVFSFETLDDGLAAMAEVEAERPTATVSDVVEEIESSNNIKDALTDVVENPNDVSVESLNFGLNMILKSHGGKGVIPSFESLSEEDKQKSVSTEARKAIEHIDSQVLASMEEYSNDVRRYIVKKLSTINSIRKTLENTLIKVKHNKKNIEEKGVLIDYKGFYDFMHRDGRLLKNIGTEIKIDLDILENVKRIVEIFNEEYDMLARCHRDGDAGIDELTSLMKHMTYMHEMSKMHGTGLMRNGKIKTDYFQDDKFLSPMQVIYYSTKNDGSIAPTEDRNKSGAIAGSITGLAFGALGAAAGFMIGGPAGAVIGGAAVGGVGGYLGYRSGQKTEDYKHRGSNTAEQLTFDEIVYFIELAIKMCDDVSHILNMLTKAEHDDIKIRRRFKEILSRVDNNALLVGTLNVLIALRNEKEKQKAKERGDDYYEETEYVKTKKEILEEEFDEIMTSMNMSYVSAIDLITEHTWTCVYWAGEVANKLSKV